MPTEGNARGPQAVTTAPRRVVVVGSINIDVVVRTTRHPRPGETVAGLGLATGLGGKGLNQAVAAARAGTPVVMVGAVGDDVDGRRAVDALRKEGIDVSGVLTKHDKATGQAVVVVDESGENAIIVIGGGNAALSADDVVRHLPALSTDDVVVLQNEITATATRETARIAHLAGATVVWNAAPAPTDATHVPAHVDVLIVNEHELHVVAELTGATAGGHVDPVVLAGAVGAGLSAAVVLTRGGAGSTIVDGERVESVPAEVVDVVDTTAAGDTYIGYLAGLLRGTTATSADLVVAGRAAGLSVTRRGASS